MATISVKTWMGPTKKRKSRATRRKDLELKPARVQLDMVGFASGGHTTRRRVIAINPHNGSFIAFIDNGWAGKKIVLPRKVGFSMYISLIKQGKYP